MFLTSSASRLRLALAFALLQACSCGSSDGESDASADGGEPDGGEVDEAGVEVTPAFDGGRDSRTPVDSGTDGATARDAAGDAGPRGPAGWLPLPGLPDGCRIERATKPNAVMDVEWEPCGPGSGGCLKLADDDTLQRAIDPGTGYHDGTDGYFAVIAEREDDPEERRLAAIAATSGEVVAAWRGPNVARLLAREQVCMVEARAVNAGYVAWSIESLGPDWPHEARIYHAALEDASSTTEPIGIADRDLYPAGNSIQRLAVSPSLVAAQVEPGGFTALFDETGPLVLPSLSGAPGHVHAVADRVLWQHWAEPMFVAHGSRSEGSAPYLAVDGADVRSFATDGTDIAWMQGYDRQPDGSYGRAELWAAAHEADPAAIEPREVGPLPSRVRKATVGGGHYAYGLFDEWYEVRLHRLGDGAAMRWELPRTHNFTGPPLYVAADEVAIPVGSVMRIAIDSFEVVE